MLMMIRAGNNLIQILLNGLQEQFQLKPGKPSITASLQALLSVLVPLGVGVLTGHPTASAIAIMGAWFVGLVNIEGVYRQQTTAKVIAAINSHVVSGKFSAWGSLAVGADNFFGNVSGGLYWGIRSICSIHQPDYLHYVYCGAGKICRIS
jgi:hypothetical protein